MVGYPFKIQGQSTSDVGSLNSLHVCVFGMSILGETLCMDNIFVFVVQQAVQVKLFIQELHKTNMLDGVSYTYWDENYTSRV